MLPSYSYYDYLTLNKFFKSTLTPSTKNLTLENFFFSSVLKEKKSLSESSGSKIFATNNYYTNPVQFDEQTTIPKYTKSLDFFQIPLLQDLNENDETYNNYKNLTSYNNTFSSVLLGIGLTNVAPNSYLNIVNNFRGDYEDFG